MAYDLAFWTDFRTGRPAPESVYAELVSGQPVEGLGRFHSQAAVSALNDHFVGLVTSPIDATGSAVWEAPDGGSVFEFQWSPQHLVATARGRYTNEHMNCIIDACVETGGGRLYDPQTGERFDSQ